MPNLINQLALDEIKQEVERMGSCVVLGFDKLTVKEDERLRGRLADAGLRYRVVKNRIARLAFKSLSLDAAAAFQGKCALVLAPGEDALKAARLVREVARDRGTTARLEIRAGVLEGRLLLGPEAQAMADMPDRQGLRAMMATALAGPATALARALGQVGEGLARAVQARADQGAGAGQDADAGQGGGAGQGGDAGQGPEA